MLVNPSQLKFSSHTEPSPFLCADGTPHDEWSVCTDHPRHASITFDSLMTEVGAVVKYGLGMGESNYWCEEASLFDLKLSSQHDLSKFLGLNDQVQNELASRITVGLR